MNTSALILMVLVQLTVISLTGYFFYRVVKTPPREEPDSYADNDDVVR
jgi:hypothetical protein